MSTHAMAQSQFAQRIIDTLPYPLFWKGLDLRYLGCNSAFAALAGLPDVEAVVGLEDFSLPWREHAEAYRRVDLRVLASGAPVDIEEAFTAVGGERRWLQTTKVPLYDGAGALSGVLGLLVDITSRREAQDQLKVALSAGAASNRLLQQQALDLQAAQRALSLSELRLRTVVRGAPLILWSLDAQGLFTFSDGAGLRELGLRPGEIVGLSVFDLYKDVPDNIEQTRRALAGETVVGHVQYGETHYETRYSPVLDAEGRPAGIIGLATDITERRRYLEKQEAELERTRAQLLQVERLASLGTLAAGVGHELRNISTVLDSLRTAFRECAERGEPPGREELEDLERVCEHVSTHGRHLMELGRPGSAKVERVDLRELVGGALAMLRTAGVTRHLTVLAPEADKPVWVEASRTRVEQVLLNLVRNAADAVESVRGRPAEVRVRLFEDAPAGFACCRVEDTGVGIAPEQLGSIFDPWFTTKPVGRGTGLGLPVVRNLLWEAGGDLAVESQLGQGSAFTFRLPLAPPPKGA